MFSAFSFLTKKLNRAVLFAREQHIWC